MDGDEIPLVCPIGTVLRAKYRLDRVLGVGGMAVVYAATHRNQKRFAIKMLRSEIAARSDVRARFLREGYAANSVDHPGAVAVLDDDLSESGAAFLVMELLDGESVERIWENSGRKLPLGAALAIAHQLADVLVAAHAKGIVHRDIKPANLFVTRDGHLKVLDFGIARVRDAAASSSGATEAGLVLGTPAFMAPEQALAGSAEIDARTDLWAAGATLFALLTGRSVHEGDNGQQVLVRAATVPAPSLATVDPDAPRSVTELVDRALAFDRSQRWPTAEAMRDALGASYRSVCGRIAWRTSLLALLGEVEPRTASTSYFDTLASWLPQTRSVDRRTHDSRIPAVDGARGSEPEGASLGPADSAHVVPARDRTASNPDEVAVAWRTSQGVPAMRAAESQSIHGAGLPWWRAWRAALPSKRSLIVGSLSFAGAFALVAVTVGVRTKRGTEPIASDPSSVALLAARPRAPAIPVDASPPSLTVAPVPVLASTPAISVDAGAPSLGVANVTSGRPRPAMPATRAPGVPPLGATQELVASAPVASGEVFLNINSLPPSVCYLDGKEIGESPRMHVSVTPGPHVVTFVVPDQGVSKTISVTVDAGETKLATARIDVAGQARRATETSTVQSPECMPPYTTDATGLRHYNPNCFGQ